MTETRHVKLGFEEALNAKKQLLSTELSILHTIKRIKSYKLLRKRELTAKNKLRTSTKILNSKINLILSTFPNEEGAPRVPKKRKKRKDEEEKQDIKQELEEIQNKLAKLN
jgi:hypothetical protein